MIGLINCINEIKNMSYLANSACSLTSLTDGKHEESIKKLLISNGFIQYLQPKLKDKNIKDIKFTKDMINGSRPSILPIGYFIHQPLGTQNNPDFVIQLTKKSLLSLEGKSSQTAMPMYNSGGVTLNYLYVFASKKINKTVIYMGASIITQIQIKLLNELIQKQKKLQDEYNLMLKEADTNFRGISYYTRPMITQSGCKEKTNYFTHKDYKLSEEKVFEYINSLQ